MARYNLGNLEGSSGNWMRALKHHTIAVRGGDDNSLKKIQQMFRIGVATKDDYSIALRYHQEYIDEIKSPQRDEAAAIRGACKYY